MTESTQLPATILVAEDEPDQLAMVCESLVDEGYHVLIATRGDEALRILDATPVDLVILDVRMPGMEGGQVLRTIRQSHKVSGVGVIVVSAFATPGEMYGYRQRGADACLSKPFLFDELLAAIKGVLEAHPTRK